LIVAVCISCNYHGCSKTVHRTLFSHWLSSFCCYQTVCTFLQPIKVQGMSLLPLPPWDPNQTMQLFSFRKCEIYFGSLATTVRFLGEQRKRFMKKLGTNWWFEQLSNSRIWKKSTRQWGELTVCFNGELRWHTFGTSSFPFWQTGAMLVVVTTTHTSISPSAVDSFALVLEFLFRNSQEKWMQIQHRCAWRVGITTEFLGFPYFCMVSGFLLHVFLLHNLYISGFIFQAAHPVSNLLPFAIILEPYHFRYLLTCWRVLGFGI
jgi:hypothetical protein